MAHFTPENEELGPEPTAEGDGRWEMEEGSVELHLGQMEDGSEQPRRRREGVLFAVKE